VATQWKLLTEDYVMVVSHVMNTQKLRKCVSK